MKSICLRYSILLLLILFITAFVLFSNPQTGRRNDNYSGTECFIHTVQTSEVSKAY